MPFFFTDRTSISMYARDTHADGSISVTSPIAVTVVPQNPGVFAQYGTDPRPAFAFHGFSNAIATIQLNGTINAGDMANIVIGSNTYTYTVLATDTLFSVATALAAVINAGPDPNVTASVANQFESIVLTANVPGPAGEGIAISESVTGTSVGLSITVYNATTCCDNTQGAPVTNDNPAVPGEIVYVLATGLGPPNPSNVDTGAITPSGNLNPPAVPVDSILTDQSSSNILSASLVPGLVGVYYVYFQIPLAATTDPLAQTTVAQQAFVSNVVTFPIVALPTSTATTSSRAGKSRGRKPAAR
jgi:hypothetical protein